MICKLNIKRYLGLICGLICYWFFHLCKFALPKLLIFNYFFSRIYAKEFFCFGFYPYLTHIWRNSNGKISLKTQCSVCVQIQQSKGTPFSWNLISITKLTFKHTILLVKCPYKKLASAFLFCASKSWWLASP